MAFPKGHTLAKTCLCTVLSTAVMVTSIPQAYAQSAEGEIVYTEQDIPAIEQAADALELDTIVTPGTESAKTIEAIENKVDENWAPMQVEITKEVEAEIAKDLTPAPAPAHVTPEVHKQSKIQKLLSKLKIRKSFDLVGFDFGKANLIGRLNAKYEYSVEPSLRDGDIMRKDTWYVDLNGNAKQIFAGGQIKVTFTRIFTGKGAQWNAIKAKPYTFMKIPKTAHDIKTQFNNGDSTRIEVLGRLGLAHGKGSISGQFTRTASVSYTREALFMVDVYRYNKDIARTRFLGLKNQGAYGFNAGVNASKNVLSFLPSSIKKALSVGINLGFSNSDTIAAGEYPIDTLMVDYIYNFAAPTREDSPENAEQALNQVLKEIRKFGFLVLFNPLAKKDNVSNGLLERAALSEKLNKIDRDAVGSHRMKAQDMRVRTAFKGRVRSSLLSTNITGNLSRLIEASNESGMMKSHVISFDHNDRKSYYLLDNAFAVQKFEAFGTYFQSRLIHDIDLLVTSNEHEEPLDISDIVVKTTLEDKDMSTKQIDSLKKILIKSLPESLNVTDKINGFFPTSKQSNATMSYQFNFGLDAFRRVSNLDTDTLRKRLDKFFDEHPERHKMGLPPYNNESGDNYFMYVQNLASKLAIMLEAPPMPENLTPAQQLEFSKKLTAERLAVFRQLKGDVIFQKYIFGEFFASMITGHDVKKDMALRLTFTSSETPSKIEQIGDLAASSVYQAVGFVRSVINDRSFDLRMGTRIDTDGSTVVEPVQYINMHNPAIVAPK